MRCATCGGHPPAGFACLACGAIPGSDHPAASTSAAGMRAPSTVQDGMATAEGTPGSLVPMTKAQVGG
jgi:hypothetical protein